MFRQEYIQIGEESPGEQAKLWPWKPILILITTVIGLAPHTHLPHATRPELIAAVKHNKIETKEAKPRTIYRFSVVVGGVYNREELARARRTDQVVESHYRGFSNNPRFFKSSRDMLVYVSYRKRDRVYWTRTRHRVPQGELLLAGDGQMARARCGNQLSLVPQSPVEKDAEPEADVLSQAEPPTLPLLADNQPADAPGADLFIPDSPPRTPTGLPALASAAVPANSPAFGSAGAPGPGLGGYPMAGSGGAGRSADPGRSNNVTGAVQNGTAAANTPAVISQPMVTTVAVPPVVVLPGSGIPISTPEPSYTWFTCLGAGLMAGWRKVRQPANRLKR